MGSFTDYQNRVKYDYIFDVFIKENTSFKDKIEDIQKLFSDEDFLAIYFKEPALGSVYVDVHYSSLIKQIVCRFGIITRDRNKDFTSKTLIDDIIECILSLNKNIELYDNKDQITKEDIKYNIAKEPKKEFESYDHKLVTEGKLDFVSDMLESLILTNEGKVEYYINNGLYESFDFSKQKVNTLCEKLTRQGAILNETIDYDEIDKDETNLDNKLDQTEDELRQGIEDVDKLQNLKDELLTKVDQLVNETLNNNTDTFKTLNESKFPSTNKTDKLLTKKEIEENDLEDYLNKNQIDWIENNIINIKEFKNKFKELYNLVGVDEDEPLISINQYIKEVLKGDKKND